MPTEAQIVSAKTRIHKALDSNKQIPLADIETIGGEPALKDLKESRQALQEAAKIAQEEEKKKNPPKVEKLSLDARDLPGSEEKPRLQTKSEREWEDFIAHRMGPMLVILFYFFFRDWDKSAFYAPNPDECEQFSGPMSRVIAQLESLFKTPKWVHMIATTSDDTVTLLYAFAAYFDRIGILKYVVPSIKSGPKKEKKKNEQQPIKYPEEIYQNNNGPTQTATVPGLFAGWRAD